VLLARATAKLGVRTREEAIAALQGAAAQAGAPSAKN
jgi:hypothetical protein